MQLNERPKTQRTQWNLKLSTFEFQLSFYPRIWNTLSLLSGFVSGTPFNFQTSTEKTKPKTNPLAKYVSLLTCYWNNSGFKTPEEQSCYCSGLSLGRSDQTKCVRELPGKGIWDFVLYCHLVSAAEPSHELLPTHSHSSLALFLLPTTSYRATPPPCFMPKRKVRPFQGPQMAWFRKPCLFSWSFRVCLSFSAAISSLFLSPEWSSNACGHYLVAHFGKPTASSSKEQYFLNPKAEPPISHNIHKYFHKGEWVVVKSEVGTF